MSNAESIQIAGDRTTLCIPKDITCMARFAHMEALVGRASDADILRMDTTITRGTDMPACQDCHRPMDKKFGSHTSGELISFSRPVFVIHNLLYAYQKSLNIV